MAQTKETGQALLDRLPDDCTLDDVLYHLYVIQAVESGLEDVPRIGLSPTTWSPKRCGENGRPVAPSSLDRGRARTVLTARWNTSARIHRTPQAIFLGWFSTPLSP